MSIHLITDYASILVGLQVYFLLNKKHPLGDTHRFIYLIGGLVGALIGSRALALLNDPALLSHGFQFGIMLGNKTIIGALAGGIIGIEIAKRFMGISRRTGDDTVIPLMVAIIIGRIGCQLTGVSDGTIGLPCDLPWCFQQGDAFARHPLPLYEITALLITLPLAWRAYSRRVLPEGMLFRFLIIGYFGLRFFLEFIKDEPRLFLSLSAIQMVCLAACVIYIYDVAGELLSGNKVIQNTEVTSELRS